MSARARALLPVPLPGRSPPIQASPPFLLRTRPSPKQLHGPTVRRVDSDSALPLSLMSVCQRAGVRMGWKKDERKVHLSLCRRCTRRVRVRGRVCVELTLAACEKGLRLDRCGRNRAIRGERRTLGPLVPHPWRGQCALPCCPVRHSRQPRDAPGGLDFPRDGKGENLRCRSRIH